MILEIVTDNIYSFSEVLPSVIVVFGAIVVLLGIMYFLGWLK